METIPIGRLSILLLLVVASPAYSGDEGFRFVNGKCQNETGETGLNPNYIGQCGSWLGANLESRDFANLDLRGSDFRRALLDKVNFSNAVLDAGVLSGATLVGADLKGLKCRKCSIINAYVHADLSGADFSDAYMERSDFSESTMDNVVFSRSVLSSAKFVHSRGARIRMDGVTANRATFNGANLSGNFSGISARQASFVGAELSGNFESADLREIRAQGVKIVDSSFVGSKLQRAILTSSTIENVRFDQANLIGADFFGADFSGNTFRKTKYSVATKVPFASSEWERKGATRWNPVRTAGGFSTCVESQYGLLHCTGSGRFGILGTGNTNDLKIPRTVSGIEGELRSIDVLSGHMCAVDRLGRALCTGNNSIGAVGQETGVRYYKFTPVAVQPEPFVQISTGLMASCAVGESKRLYCWGYEAHASALPTRSRTPKLVNFKKKVQRIELGGYHGCIQTENGELFCFGGNKRGQLGLGSSVTQTYQPMKVSFPAKVVDYGLGFQHTCVLLENNEVNCFGWGEHGQLGTGNTEDRYRPVPTKSIPAKISRISVGGTQNFALTEEGSLYAWGKAAYGQTGIESESDILQPTLVKGLPKVKDVVAGFGHACVITEKDETLCFGGGLYGQRGDNSNEDGAKPSKFLID